MHGAYEMHAIVVLLIVLFLCVAFPFKFKCPPESQWRIRAKAKCGAGSEKQYSCLFDENTNTYVESCNREIDYVAAGHKYVIIGLPTDRECNQNRYQPTKFWINSNHHCVYLKSLCNELGQRFLPSESAREDVKCRCDHTLGYAFVTTPANLCYCKPEKEDCSCYSKLCGDNGILLSDYECMSENHSEENSKCRSLVGLSGKNKDKEEMDEIQINELNMNKSSDAIDELIDR